MNSHYYHGLPENAGNVRFQHYPTHNSEKEYVCENEPQQSFAIILESVPLGTDEENVQLLNQIDQSGTRTFGGQQSAPCISPFPVLLRKLA